MRDARRTTLLCAVALLLGGFSAFAQSYPNGLATDSVDPRSDAVTIRDVQRLRDEGRIEERLLPADSLFSREMSAVSSAQEEKRIRCGSDYPTALKNGVYRVYSREGIAVFLNNR